MTIGNLGRTVMAWHNRHPEAFFVLKALMLAYAFHLFRGWLYNLRLFLFFAFLFSPAFVWIYVNFRAEVTGKGFWTTLHESVSLLPVLTVENEEWDKKIPFVTLTIIAINALVFYFVQPGHVEQIRANFICLPREPNWWNVMVSPVTAMFLHGSTWHLWGNMLFLWGIGASMEKRLGARFFLSSYFATGIVSGLTWVAIKWVVYGTHAHYLGASGAVSGMMGLFAVRCYFKTLAMPLPVLGLLSIFWPVCLRVRMNALTLVAMFFIADLSRGIGQIDGTMYSRTAHWVHIGGILAGIGLGVWFKLGKKAMGEKHLDAGRSNHESYLSHDQRGQSLRQAVDVLKDTETKLLLARNLCKYEPNEEGRQLYSEVLAKMVRQDPVRAGEIFVEAMNATQRALPDNQHFSLAGLLHRQGNLPQVGRALDMLIDGEDISAEFREKAMYHLARLLDQMGYVEAATDYFTLFLERYPLSVFQGHVVRRLGV